MEKFSNWRDQATGISPFLPKPVQTSAILGWILTLLRVPLVLFVVLLHCVTFGLFEKFFAQLLLWSLGVFSIQISIEGVRRSENAKKSPRLPHPGDLLAVNFSSPLDVLVLKVLFNPVFLVPNANPDGPLLRQLSLFQCFRFALSPPVTTNSTGTRRNFSATQILQIARQAGRPVAVFFEGTTSNGSALLPVSPELQAGTVVIDSSAKPSFKVASLKYSPNSVTTPIPSGIVAFLVRVMSELATSVRIRVSDQVEAVPESTEAVHVNWGKLRDALSVSSRLRKLGQGLDTKSKSEFLAAWARGHKVKRR